MILLDKMLYVVLEVVAMTAPVSIFASVSSTMACYYATRSLAAFFAGTRNGSHISPKIRDLHEQCFAELQASLRRVDAQLDNNPTIDPTLLARLRKQLDWKLVERARALKAEFYKSCRVEPMSALDQAFFAKLRDKTRLARQYEHVSRMVWEMAECDANDWFPVFVTLTVRPQHYDDVFRTNSRCFREYIRTIRRQIGRRLGMSKRVAEASDIHRYFAVVERGGHGDRLHIHILHFCKALPVEPNDPNCGRLVADRRQLPAWCRSWDFGFATAYPVRTGPQDVYARLGWRWPVQRVKGKDCWQPYPAKGPRAVAQYMGKYIAKQYGNKRKDVWRCRMTRNLGLTFLSKTIELQTTRRLFQVMDSPLPTINHLGRSLSHSLIRRQAARTLLSRCGSRTAYVKVLSTLVPAQSLHMVRMTGTSLIQTSTRMADCRWLCALFESPRREIPLRGLATGLSV